VALVNISLQNRVGDIAMVFRLNFVDDTDQALADATSNMLDEVGLVALRPDNQRAQAIAEAVRVRHPGIQARSLGDKVVLSVDATARGEPDAWTLLESDGRVLAAELMKFIDCDSARIVAPITDRHSSRNPVFVISIPKAGTHLLHELLRQFGYHNGETLPQNPPPQHRYFIDNGTPHTDAPSFFFNHPWRQHAAHIGHPFHGSAAAFIYRHPYDVLVSEAHWYSTIDLVGGVMGYLAGLSTDAVMCRLANDPWLFGSLRDRVGKFAAWLSFPNVIPLSYEELVGPRGGGSLQRQRTLIWSMQLKLQVAGTPDEIADKVYNPDSATFRTGRAGDYRSALPLDARQELAKLPSDYLQVFGYDADFETNRDIYPRHADEFRRRPLEVGRPTLAPLLMEQDYLGFNIVLYRGKYFAMRIGDGPLALALQLPFPQISESMGNHDSKIVDADSVD
jgi:hypothetical protein